MIDVYSATGTFSDKAISTAAGRNEYVRVQVLTPAGVLDRDKQLGVVKELTEIVARAAGDPTLAQRTDIATAARAALFGGD
jgi:hypothetical protein